MDLEIVALAEELGAGLIVIGRSGTRGVRRALMGSVSDSVVRHALPSVGGPSRERTGGVESSPNFRELR